MTIPCQNKDCTATTTETVPALGHSWGAWTVTKTATAYETGEETRECARCKTKETRTIPINSSATTATINDPSFFPSSTSDQVAYLPTQLTDMTNGVILQFRAGTVDSKTTLVVTKSDQTSTSVKYDITLMRNGVAIQPNDTLYITIYIPGGMSGSTFYVYRVEEGGGYTNMGAVATNAAVNFKTGHLSEYILTTTPLIESDAAVTPSVTAAPPSSSATTPPPNTSATTPKPSSVEFEFETTTSSVPQTPPSSDNTTKPPDVVLDGTTPPPASDTKKPTNSGQAGNTNPGDDNPDKNVSTGILAVSIPLIAAAIGIFVAKKR